MCVSKPDIKTDIDLSEISVLAYILSKMHWYAHVFTVNYLIFLIKCFSIASKVKHSDIDLSADIHNISAMMTGCGFEALVTKIFSGGGIFYTLTMYVLFKMTSVHRNVLNLPGN